MQEDVNVRHRDEVGCAGLLRMHVLGPSFGRKYSVGGRDAAVGDRGAIWCCACVVYPTSRHVCVELAQAPKPIAYNRGEWKIISRLRTAECEPQADACEMTGRETGREKDQETESYSILIR